MSHMVHPLIKSISLNLKPNSMVLFIALVMTMISRKTKIFISSSDDCQNDLPKLELTSRSGVTHKIDFMTNPSPSNEIHFEQDNLLPGKYSGNLSSLSILVFLEVLID